jgi:activating signal cointegrator 1
VSNVYGLTLWEPWATMMALGFKRVETRSWAPRVPLGSIVCVHASLAWNRHLAMLTRQLQLSESSELLPSGWQSELGGPPVTLGNILSVHRLKDVQQVGADGAEAILCEYYRLSPDELAGIASGRIPPGIGADLSDIVREESLGDYSVGRWAWHMPLMKRLECPLGRKGRQGLWRIDDLVTLRAIKEEIGG